MTFVWALLASLAGMAVIDGLWLGVVARTFYRSQAGHLMADSPNWIAAVAFYLLYTVGITILAVMPAVDEGSVLTAVWRGAFVGLFAYGTYDLTNAATLRGWPTTLTIVDMAWGTFLTAAVATIAAFVVINFT